MRMAAITRLIPTELSPAKPRRPTERSAHKKPGTGPGFFDQESADSFGKLGLFFLSDFLNAEFDPPSGVQISALN